MSPQAEQIIRDIQRLPPGERARVYDWLDEHKDKRAAKPLFEEDSEALFLQRLLEKGLISEIAEPMSDAEDAEFEPIEVEGEPLSEMIIRERR